MLRSLIVVRNDSGIEVYQGYNRREAVGVRNTKTSEYYTQCQIKVGGSVHIL